MTKLNENKLGVKAFLDLSWLDGYTLKLIMSLSIILNIRLFTISIKVI